MHLPIAYSDIYSAIHYLTCKSHLKLLALFDVSSAFDKIDHTISFQSLQLWSTWALITWFESYISGRSQIVLESPLVTPERLGLELNLVSTQRTPLPYLLNAW